MPRMFPAFETVDDISQSRRTFGEIGRINLRNIAEAHDLGAGAGAGDERLHLLGREVLRLVDDEELVQKGATAHEIE